MPVHTKMFNSYAISRWSKYSPQVNCNECGEQEAHNRITFLGKMLDLCPKCFNEFIQTCSLLSDEALEFRELIPDGVIRNLKFHKDTNYYYADDEDDS